jgi:hypothetical protein
MLRDVEFFKAKVGPLGDSGNMAGDYLITLVKAKSVPKTKTTTPPPPPAETNAKVAEKAEPATQNGNGTASTKINGNEKSAEAGDKEKEGKPS